MNTVTAITLLFLPVTFALGVLCAAHFPALNRPLWRKRRAIDRGGWKFDVEADWTVRGPFGDDIALTDGRIAEATKRHVAHPRD